jgi:hypothetical protein
VADTIPSSAWFSSSISSARFWWAAEPATGQSNAEADTKSEEVVMQVASFLHTCLKATGMKTGKPCTPLIPGSPYAAGSLLPVDQQHYRSLDFLLSILKQLQESSLQLAALPSSTTTNTSSSSSSSKKERGSNKTSSASSSS